MCKNLKGQRPLMAEIWSPEKNSIVQWAVIGCKLKQSANEGYNSRASLTGLVLSFIACFILLVIARQIHSCTTVSSSLKGC